MAEGDGREGGKTEGGFRRWGPIIGVDLGTSFFSAAVFRNGQVDLIPDSAGSSRTPSYVAFAHGEPCILIGQPAKDQIASNPSNTIFGVKRLIGRRYEDPSVQSDRAGLPFLISNAGWFGKGRPKIQVDLKGRNKYSSPEEITSLFLRKLKEDAEVYLGREVTEAVVSVPTYFTNAQRQATRDAGRIAGLNVLRLINEPTAAAIAYGLDKRSDVGRNILVFDMGGGSLDVSIVTLKGGLFHVKATAGNTHLGGDDFDSRLVTFLIDRIRRELKRDLSKNPGALCRLRVACEEAKRVLSSAVEATVDIPGSEKLQWTISRTQFEEINSDLFRKALITVEICLNNAHLNPTQIQELVLVGGSSRIPKLHEMLSAFFNGVNEKELVAAEEAVVRGAAVQGAILAQEGSELLQGLRFIEAVPLSLCIDILGGSVNILVQRNRATASIWREVVEKTWNTQSSLIVLVHEGEDENEKRKVLLGQVLLKGIPPSVLSKAPKLQVAFDLDQVGLLRVSVSIPGTGFQREIQLAQDPTRLSSATIEEMTRSAEKLRAEENKAANRILLRTEIQTYCSGIQTLLNDPVISNNIGKKEKQFIFEKCSDLVSWLEAHKLATQGMLRVKWKELKRIWDPLNIPFPTSKSEDKNEPGLE